MEIRDIEAPFLVCCSTVPAVSRQVGLLNCHRSTCMYRYCRKDNTTICGNKPSRILLHNLAVKVIKHFRIRVSEHVLHGLDEMLGSISLYRNNVAVQAVHSLLPLNSGTVFPVLPLAVLRMRFRSQGQHKIAYIE